MHLIRLPNLICGVIFGTATFAFLATLIAGLSDYVVEPEDTWLSAIWMALLATLASLNFWNASRSFEQSGFNLRSLANTLALLLFLAIGLIGQKDPVVVLLAAFACVGPLFALFGRPSGAED